MTSDRGQVKVIGLPAFLFMDINGPQLLKKEAISVNNSGVAKWETRGDYPPYNYYNEDYRNISETKNRITQGGKGLEEARGVSRSVTCYSSTSTSHQVSPHRFASPDTDYLPSSLLPQRLM